MSNELRPNYVKIDGLEYRFRYKNRGYKWLKDKTGKNILQTLELLQDVQNLDFETLADLLYAGIISDTPEVTYEAILDAIEFVDFGDYITAVKEAVSISLPKPEPGSKKK